MAAINRVVLVGNLTRDPELRHTPSGTAVCNLRLAVNTRRKDETGQWVDKPNYFDITVWGNQGERCAQYLAKGRPVGVDGRLEWREWETPEGNKRQAVEVVADSVQFLGGRGDGDGAGGYIPADAPATPAGDFPSSPTDDDIPFEEAARWLRRRNPACGRAPGRPGVAARAATSARTRWTRWTTRTPTSSAAMSRKRARSATAASQAPAAATSARSPRRSSAPARWRSFRTCRGRDGGHSPQRRREARPERRGRRREARLRAELPASSEAGGGRHAGAGRRDPPDRRGAGAPRGALGRAGRGHRRHADEDGAPLRGEGRADRGAVRLRDADRHRRGALADAQDSRRPPQDRPRRDQADRPLLHPGARLRGRHRRGEDPRGAGGRRAAARGRARGPRGRRAGGGRGDRRRACRGGRGDGGRARRRSPRRGSPRGEVSRGRASAGGAVRDLGRAREQLTKRAPRGPFCFHSSVHTTHNPGRRGVDDRAKSSQRAGAPREQLPARGGEPCPARGIQWERVFSSPCTPPPRDRVVGTS